MLHAAVSGDDPKIDELDHRKRWRGAIRYIDGSRTRITFDRFDELNKLIERGPDHNLIDEITIHLTQRTMIGVLHP